MSGNELRSNLPVIFLQHVFYLLNVNLNKALAPSDYRLISDTDSWLSL